MINAVGNSVRLFGAETALQLLKSSGNAQSISSSTTVISPTVAILGGDELSTFSSDALSRLQEISAEKRDLNIKETGSAYHDVMSSIALALRKDATVSDDGTITSKLKMSDEELKTFFSQLMKTHIARGKISGHGLAEAIQTGKFEIVLEKDMAKTRGF